MKPYPFKYLFITFIAYMGLISSCTDIIEPSISQKTVQAQAPVDQYQSTSYTLNFWWDQVDHALSYHLQVVTPTFSAPGSLVLDTVIRKNTFSFSLNPGNYQWRVMAENGSSQTPYTPARSFNVAATSIKQQSAQLISPANNLLTNQGTIIFQWNNLYGATKWRLEIDTNDFANESTVIYNQELPVQQVSFTFPKDQTYQWRVRAENDTAQSLWSPINLITFDHTPPGKVSLVLPLDSATVTLPVSLQWNPSQTATKYKLYVYKTDKVTTYNQDFPMVLTATSYTFNLGKSGDKIYWLVTALDAAGNESPASDQRNFVLQ